MPPKVAQMIREQEEQKIFKEFEELGYKIFYNGAYVVLVNDFKKINIFTVGNAYSYTCCSTTPPTTNAYLTMKEHQLLHRLFEIWGWLE